MIWLWAFVGGLAGLALDHDYIFGPLVGAALAALVAMLFDLRRRLGIAEGTLSELRAGQTRDDTVRTPVAPAVAEVPPPYMGPHAARTSAPTAAPTKATAAPQELPPPLPTTATLQTTAPSTATPPPLLKTPPPPPKAASQEPAFIERVLAAIKRWFTEGNVPVKIGVLVLFAGVAAALRFAAAEGYFTLPIGWRLSLIATAALAGLGLGWRERTRRAVFGISLQGGSVGVLLLTVFASYRLYGLLPAGMAFAFVVVLVAGAALLAVLQQAMPLGALGFLGGYLAPVLLSTGSGNHVALFSYYAVLNAAVFAISWKQHWRLLNLIGFTFTFGVGAAWFERSYQPEMFWTVEPFLVLFFLFYVVIGFWYASRQSSDRKPWLDGTLVFGTPLVAFPMQSVLLQDNPMALAFSAIAVAGVYVGLLYWLRRHRDERLLTDAYAALALGFATLAVPLAFSAGTTTTLWALEGAAVAWMGLRQGRKLPWISGLGLQLLAAGAYLIGEFNGTGGDDWLLLNATWLGAAMLGFASIALALVQDRYKPLPMLPALLMCWGLGWWSLAGLTQISEAGDQFTNGDAEWLFAMTYLACSLLLAGGLRRWLDWPRLGWGMTLWALLALCCVPWAYDELDGVLTMRTLPVWIGYLAAWLIALWLNRAASDRSVSLTHGLGFWTVAFAVTLQINGELEAASGWHFLATIAPVWFLSLGFWRRPRWLAWPRVEAFENGYRMIWFGLALPLLALFWLAGLFQRGLAEPLPYLPLFNPLELGLAGIALLLWSYCRDRLPQVAKVTPLWVGAGFAFLTQATLRTVHHVHGESWSWNILDSGFAQTSLTVIWSLVGVIAWVAGSRLSRRPLWLAGAGLMGIVLLKLILIDRQYMGNIPGIVSFLAVGLLLVVVGYFAPSPTHGHDHDHSEESS